MIKFTLKIQERFNEMCATGKLFRVIMTGQQVWDLYLASFTKEEDPTFRDPESSSHNCNNCKNFIRRYGNIVAIDAEYNVMTLFDGNSEGEFENVSKALSTAIKISEIAEIFTETFDELNSLPYEKCSKTNSMFQLGLKVNYKQYTEAEAKAFKKSSGELIVNTRDIYTFDHLHLFVSAQFVDKSGKSAGAVMGEYRDTKNVFKRAMDEIPTATFKLMKDLINQNSLMNSTQYLPILKAYIAYKEMYEEVPGSKKDAFCWVTSYANKIGKFLGTLQGEYLKEVAEGKELNAACIAYNKRVDPANYMKATTPFTKQMKDAAAKELAERGCESSFIRRFATIDDIKVTEILHINAGKGELKAVSILDGIKPVKSQHKRSEFDGVDEVSIDKFMTDILPSCTSVETFLTNKLRGNICSLTTATTEDSVPIFKYSNNYSVTFIGNLAGKSQLTEMVEAKGGRTDGAFRFTHSWNKLEVNQSLMDLHVFMPGCKIPIQFSHGPHVKGRRIGWNSRKDYESEGTQDVDYTDAAPKGYVPVENITFPELSKMPEGVYTCAINNWAFRTTGGKGEAEIAFNGELYQYVYPATKNDEWIIVAEVTLKNGKFTIDHKLPLAQETSSEIYGLETNNFHKVNLACLSPNYWGDNKFGNKYYLFMLDKCKSPDPIVSFHSENLIPELAVHRKVLEAVGVNVMIESTDKQLSGLGFNSTVHDELIVRLAGSFKRVIKIKF